MDETTTDGTGAQVPGSEFSAPTKKRPVVMTGLLRKDGDNGWSGHLVDKFGFDGQLVGRLDKDEFGKSVLRLELLLGGERVAA